MILKHKLDAESEKNKTQRLISQRNFKSHSEN
jgi:hypothetical protein